MPVSRRTGVRYSAGSHATKDGYEHVKVCAGCGGKLTLNGLRPLWFETSAEGARGWHFECKPREPPAHVEGQEAPL